MNEDQKLSNVVEDVQIALTEISSKIEGSQAWYLDSRATRHVTSNKSLLESYTLEELGIVTTARGEKHSIEGLESAKLCINDGEIKLHKVLYVSSFKKNLISIGCLAESKKLIAFANQQCWILKKNKRLTIARIRDRGNELYKINIVFTIQDHTMKHPTDTIVNDDTKLAKLWHRRMGHLNYNSLCNLSLKDKVDGLPSINFMRDICKNCLAGKQTHERFSKHSTTRVVRILQLLHANLCWIYENSIVKWRALLYYIH